MPLKIRLARGGAKKRPFYRIVIADSRSPRDGRFIERVGTFDPQLPKDSDKRIILVKERIEHWLKVGARPTDRVLRFLADSGMAATSSRFTSTPGTGFMPTAARSLAEPRPPIEVPRALVEREMHRVQQRLEQNMKAWGGPVERLQSAVIEEQARRRVALGLILGEFVKRYGMKPESMRLSRDFLVTFR